MGKMKKTNAIQFSNYKEFQDTLKRRIAVDVKRTEAQVLNKVALQTLAGSKAYDGASQLTPKATKGGIRKDLNRKSHSLSFRGKYQRVKLLFLLASKALVKSGKVFKSWKQWNKAVADMSLRIWQARDSSRAFLSAGWNKAIKGLGGTRAVPVKAGGRADKGRVTVATPETLRAVCTNNAVEKKTGGDDPVTYALVDFALRQAISNERADMETYIKRQMEKTLAKHSDK